MTRNQKILVWTSVVILLLVILLFIFFRNRRRGEKCPDGRSIPASGNCADNPLLKDENGNTVVTPVTPDSNGCIQPSVYIVNAFPLTVGMKGDLVKQVQIRLNSDYSANLTEDGYFGCNTLAAVKKALGVQTIDAELFKNAIQGIVTL